VDLVDIMNDSETFNCEKNIFLVQTLFMNIHYHVESCS